MEVHFIAIGGSVMSQLAIELHQKGAKVTGSDDIIFDPSKSKLQAKGLLPEAFGWKEDNIHSELDFVILGMHAKPDNPELKRAEDLGLKILSYPEFIYEQSKTKKRVVIAGSHGKTTITAMLMHVMKAHNMVFDYLVGASLDGFNNQVQLTDADTIIIEGDEYLSSPIHRSPKIHYYRPDITSISGIAWDHINVFPTEENYNEQFKIYIDQIDSDGCIIYNESDPVLNKYIKKAKAKTIPYAKADYKISNGKFIVSYDDRSYEMKIAGSHNMENLMAAFHLAKALGIEAHAFFESVKSFTGASRRLQLYKKTENASIYYDFAHAPSKVKASTAAVKELWQERKLIGVFELHTYSSLTPEFLKEYKNTCSTVDELFIYFDAETLAIKNRAPLNEATLKEVFAHPNMTVISDKKIFRTIFEKMNLQHENLLIMTSGHLAGLKMEEICEMVL